MHFQLESKQIFFLNIARDLRDFLKSDDSDREQAENQANEHFYQAAEMTKITMETYDKFLDMYMGENEEEAGQQMIENFSDMRHTVVAIFEDVLAIEQHDLLVEDQEDAGVPHKQQGTDQGAEKLQEANAEEEATEELVEDANSVIEGEESAETAEGEQDN